MTNYYDIARNKIYKYRKDKKITQEKLAELRDLSEDYICEIENKKKHKTFSIDALTRIANALDIPMYCFFIVEDEFF